MHWAVLPMVKLGKTMRGDNLGCLDFPGLVALCNIAQVCLLQTFLAACGFLDFPALFGEQVGFLLPQHYEGRQQLNYLELYRRHC
jgi:hypothetical protein